MADIQSHSPASVRADAGTDSGVTVRRVSLADLGAVLRRGALDFWECPSHYVFLVIIYPVVGFVLAVWTAGGALFPLLYPLAAGFALLGPLAAIGLYEISRRREAGLDAHPRYAFAVLRSPHIGAVLRLGIVMLVIFGLWLAAAGALYSVLYADDEPAGLMALLADVFTTERGLTLLIAGNAIGFVFALVALIMTAISFPLLLDKGGTATDAVATSARVFLANPVPILAWGLIVAVLLLIGSIPLFVGLAIVLPILGHATWHLYRKATA